MKQTIFNYLYELYSHTSEVCAQLELDLMNSECVGDWLKETKIKLKEHTKRKNELWECLKFIRSEKTEA